MFRRCDSAFIGDDAEGRFRVSSVKRSGMLDMYWAFQVFHAFHPSAETAPERSVSGGLIRESDLEKFAELEFAGVHFAVVSFVVVTAEVQQAV